MKRFISVMAITMFAFCFNVGSVIAYSYNTNLEEDVCAAKKKSAAKSAKKKSSVGKKSTSKKKHEDEY